MGPGKVPECATLPGPNVPLPEPLLAHDPLVVPPKLGLPASNQASLLWTFQPLA